MAAGVLALVQCCRPVGVLAGNAPRVDPFARRRNRHGAINMETAGDRIRKDRQVTAASYAMPVVQRERFEVGEVDCEQFEGCTRIGREQLPSGSHEDKIDLMRVCTCSDGRGCSRGAAV